MDWQLAIEKNREALKRVLAMLVAMAGLSDLHKGGEASAAGSKPSEPRTGAAVPTLPRHLHRLVLRLLRPAEAATRRLIIVAARGLVVEVPPLRLRKPKQQSIFVRDGVGTGIVRRGSSETALRPAPRRLSLPLFDPLKRFGTRRRYVAQSAAPRIRSFDDMRVPLFQPPRQPDPLPLSSHDLLDAGRLARRLDAIGRVLDDLPRQAKRLARWQARRDARLAEGRDKAEAADLPPCGGDVRQDREGQRRALCAAPDRDTKSDRPRTHRFSPMRPGHPPGWRRRRDHQVYDVLSDLHGLAAWAMARPDTS